jgi:anti-sigma regulatory factor (Ser/Thr protein kinase)
MTGSIRWAAMKQPPGSVSHRPAARARDAWRLALSDQAGGGIRHVAWLYRTRDEYLAGVGEFVQSAASAGEPVLIALPAGRLAPDLNVPAMPGTRTLDAADLGRNPARMMPVVRAFADEHRGQRIRVLSEMAWAGRSAAELGEVARYEMMVNRAFAGISVTMLCMYDAAGLPGSTISGACFSHPWVRQGGREDRSGEYLRAQDGAGRQEPSMTVPPGAQTISYQNDLRPVRALVAVEADRAGLSASRRTDLVIAASEVAANTLKHTDGPGLVRVWVTSDEILCQFDDSGHIRDPLAGYGRPSGDEPGGQGLWLVNQVCDLAEIRSSALGTTIRMHMFRDVSQPFPASRERVHQPR